MPGHDNQRADALGAILPWHRRWACRDLDLWPDATFAYDASGNLTNQTDMGTDGYTYTTGTNLSRLDPHPDRHDILLHRARRWPAQRFECVSAHRWKDVAELSAHGHRPDGQ